MRYIMVVFLGLSFSAMALESNVQNDSNASSKILLKKIQQDAGKYVCDPGKELHMTPFN